MQRGNVLLLAFAYVVMGSAMGTVAGTGLAMASFHSGIPTLVFQVAPSVQAGSSADSVVKPPPQSSVLTSQAVDVPSSMANPSALKLTKANFQVTHHRRHAHQRRALLKPIALTAVPTQVATLPYVPVAAPVTAPVTAAVAAPEVKNYRFISEGDVTVADFDASMGRIETYEGRTFAISATAVASAATSLQDSGVSVHYRCDQSGSCTLMHAGLIMQNVRLM